MKLRYKWAFAFLVVLFLIAILLLLPQTSKDVIEVISKYFPIKQGEGGVNESLTTTSITEEQIPNQTSGNETEEKLPGTRPGTITEEEKAEKALTLGLIDICSGKLNLFIISEGATSCLNKGPPYYAILEKNSTHLTASLKDEDFSEVYELNDTVLIFYIFAEDVASVSHEIQSFSLEGSPKFHLGEYYLHTIWERDASGNLAISKMIVALSLYVDREIASSNEWKELKLYLNIPNKTYYLGNLWVLVK